MSPTRAISPAASSGRRPGRGAPGCPVAALWSARPCSIRPMPCQLSSHACKARSPDGIAAGGCRARGTRARRTARGHDASRDASDLRLAVAGRGPSLRLNDERQVASMPARTFPVEGGDPTSQAPSCGPGAPLGRTRGRSSARWTVVRRGPSTNAVENSRSDGDTPRSLEVDEIARKTVVPKIRRRTKTGAAERIKLERGRAIHINLYAMVETEEPAISWACC